ncbi:hypothetical protein DFP72DRAFT_1082028 [Ephemerocybe angulata]|uniref:Uncharacterized protein n=1 Tax=Ephemerocybe angulata TaxID=980116 RepID=A0A8H6LVJ7_9AGAR|nr:hypothetical protein DFP72DRAFT_1082028 [Tulosesus angulatus]
MTAGAYDLFTAKPLKPNCIWGQRLGDNEIRAKYVLRFPCDFTNRDIEVHHTALLASVAHLTAAETAQLAQSLLLMYLSQSLSYPAHTWDPAKSNHVHLTEFLSAPTPLCSTNPSLFPSHLPALLIFVPQLILPAVDCGPMPTVGRPFPASVGIERGGCIGVRVLLAQLLKLLNPEGEHAGVKRYSQEQAITTLAIIIALSLNSEDRWVIEPRLRRSERLMGGFGTKDRRE